MSYYDFTLKDMKKKDKKQSIKPYQECVRFILME